MIEHRAAGVANAQRFHQRRRSPAGEPVGERAPRPGPPASPPSRSPSARARTRRRSRRSAVAPVRRRRRRRGPSVRTGSLRARAGTDTARAATALTALSRYASQARRPRGLTARQSAIATAGAHPAGRRSSATPPPNSRPFEYGPGKKCDLAVERAGAAQAERPRRSACAVDDASVLDGDRRRERAAQLEQDERDVPLCRTRAARPVREWPARRRTPCRPYPCRRGSPFGAPAPTGGG